MRSMRLCPIAQSQRGSIFFQATLYRILFNGLGSPTDRRKMQLYL